MSLTWWATAAFGLEGQVRREIEALGFSAQAESGGVRFSGTAQDAFWANLWLRTADRVLLLTAEEKVTTYEELFQLVRSIAWEKYLPRDAAFPVAAQCARSQLMSPRDCQAITKKAMVERLKATYRTEWFQETGATYQVRVLLHNDIARICLDSSGEALNRRGYRTWTGEAPLRETLAAALVDLSPWRPGMPLYDPCCGTGTLLVEAAYLMANRAPGLSRSFAMEGWRMLDANDARALREQAHSQQCLENIQDIAGSDIDVDVLTLCKKHIKQASISNRITVTQQDVYSLPALQPGTVILTNPPYGERMGDHRQAERLYQRLYELHTATPDSRLCVFTAHAGFERVVGKKAARKRRLYNGRLECGFLIY
ncbi:MAG: THUMP domain-containing class I SAM-dependent RNA methyltransferase [Christensenellales bacterium]|jgi:putative N6-adenine-specific DNA methylase